MADNLAAARAQAQRDAAKNVYVPPPPKVPYQVKEVYIATHNKEAKK